MYLSRKLSYYVAKVLLENGAIREGDLKFYEYCYEFFFEQFLDTAIVLILGLLLHCFVTTLIFLSVFSFFRYCSGGIHAPTEKICSVISFCMYAFVLIVIPRCSFKNFKVWAILFAVSVLCIIVLAPVENDKKQFTKKQKKQLKYICYAGIFCLSLIFILFSALHFCLYYGTISVCMTVVAISVILAFLRKGKMNNVIADSDM